MCRVALWPLVKVMMGERHFNLRMLFWSVLDIGGSSSGSLGCNKVGVCFVIRSRWRSALIDEK